MTRYFESLGEAKKEDAFHERNQMRELRQQPHDTPGHARESVGGAQGGGCA